MTPNRLIRRLAQACRSADLIAPLDLVLAAVSGGSDSMALLDLLRRWQADDGGFFLVAGHFHHGLRPEADAEQELVASYCRAHRVELRTGSGDVGDYSRRTRLSVHAAARRLRYRWLADAALSAAAELAAAGTPPRRVRIATAHQRDDQAETIIMRLLSGAGPEGLAGIRRTEELRGVPAVKVVRPLLHFPRRELEEYCQRNGISFARDRTNSDPRYPRALVRRQILPFLRQVWKGRVDAALIRAAENLGAWAEKVEAEVGEAWRNSSLDKDEEGLELDYEKWISYNFLIRIGIIQRAYGAVAGDAARISRERLIAAETHLRVGRRSEINLGGGYNAWTDGRVIRVGRCIHPDYLVQLRPGDRTEIPGSGWLEVGLASARDCPLPPRRGEQYADYDALGPGPYTLRPARPGDSIKPVGAPRQRVVEILRAAGVPVWKRRAPVVEVSGFIAVVPPWRVADDFKLTSRSQTAVVFALRDR